MASSTNRRRAQTDTNDRAPASLVFRPCVVMAQRRHATCYTANPVQLRRAVTHGGYSRAGKRPHSQVTKAQCITRARRGLANDLRSAWASDLMQRASRM
eukprot:6179337-Pleurochrysis_carterae.AAC.3